MLKTIFTPVIAGLLFLPILSAYAEERSDIDVLRSEIKSLKQAYEAQILQLEKKIQDIQQTQKKQQESSLAAQNADTGETIQPAQTSSKRQIFSNRFNPSIGLILNGKYNYSSSDETEFTGFAVGEEGESHGSGFSVEHSELNFAANVDDKFYGSLTAALAEHHGETEVELEEAYIQTLAGLGLPTGLSLKVGRAFWTLGYLNEHHNHTDDFADRPLPYRVFLNGVYNDDGLQASYLLPFDFYSEIGGGIFQGKKFPFSEGDGKSLTAWSAYVRVGGDVSDNQNWRLGAYLLSGKADEERFSNEGELGYQGDTDLYIADLRYVWAPTGNARQQEVTFQGEYFRRYEKGQYRDLSIAGVTGLVDGASSGWYVQGVYRFDPQWRAGLRYSQITPSDLPLSLKGGIIDAKNHTPDIGSFMIDWTNSEFSRIRFQYDYERLIAGEDNHRFTLQYIMSIGAHGAHKY